MKKDQVQDPSITIETLQIFEQLTFDNNITNCKIFKCKMKNDIEKKQYALKIFEKQKELNNEINFFNSVEQHPNIVKCLSYDENDYIILELMKNGDLQYYIQACKGKFPVNLARFYFKQALIAVKHIHDSYFIHRDIKLENILVGDDYDIQLCDFAYSCQIKPKDQYLTQYQGTKGYMSPQMANIIPYNGYKNDIFSLGVTLFAMVLGFCPFEKTSSHDKMYRYFQDNMEIVFWDKIKKENGGKLDGDFIDLINGMLCAEEDFRLSIDEINDHPWMQKEMMGEQDRINYMRSLKQKIIKKQNSDS